MCCQSTERICSGLAPRIMGVGPTIAIPKVLEKVGLSVEDVDLFEVCKKKKKYRSYVTMAVDQRSIRFHVRVLRAQAQTQS